MSLFKPSKEWAYSRRRYVFSLFNPYTKPSVPPTGDAEENPIGVAATKFASPRIGISHCEIQWLSWSHQTARDIHWGASICLYTSLFPWVLLSRSWKDRDRLPSLKRKSGVLEKGSPELAFRACMLSLTVSNSMAFLHWYSPIDWWEHRAREENGIGCPEQECDKHLFIFFPHSWLQKFWLNAWMGLTGQCCIPENRGKRHLDILLRQACLVTWCNLAWLTLGPLWGCCYSQNCALETLSSVAHRAKSGTLVLEGSILVSFARVMCLSLGAHT